MLNSIRINIEAILNPAGVVRGGKVVERQMDRINAKAKASMGTMGAATAAYKDQQRTLAQSATAQKAANKERQAAANTNRSLHNSEIFIQKAWEDGSNLVDKRYLQSLRGLREAHRRLRIEAQSTIVAHRGLVTTLSDPRLASAQKRMANDLSMRTFTNMATNMQNRSKNMQWTGRQMMVGVTAPIAAIGAVSIMSYRELGALQVRLRKVLGDSYGANQVEIELDKIKKKATELSEQYGLARTEMVRAGEVFAKAGIVGPKLTENIELATELQIVGDVDMDVSTELVRMMSKMGYSTEFLHDQLQKLNLIDDRTSISLKNLAAALVEVQPLMEDFGLSVADTGALIAGIRQAGYSEGEAAIALRNLFTKMPAALGGIQSGDPQQGTRLKALMDTARSLNELTGINIDVVTEDGQIKNGIDLVTNLAHALAVLKESGDPQLVARIFGDLRNIFAAEQAGEGRAFFDSLAVVIEGGSNDLARALEVAQGEVGSAAQAWQDQIEAYENSDVIKFQKELEKLKNSAQDLGETLMPFATDLLDKINALVKGFMNMPESTKKMIFSLLGLVALVGPITYAVGQMGVLFSTLLKGGLGFARKMVPALRPIGVSLYGISAASKTVDDAFFELIGSLRRGEISTTQYIDKARGLVDEFSEMRTSALGAADAIDEIAESHHALGATAPATLRKNSGMPVGGAVAPTFNSESIVAESIIEAMPYDPESIIARDMAAELIRESSRVNAAGQDVLGQQRVRVNYLNDLARGLNTENTLTNESLQALTGFRQTFGFDMPVSTLDEADRFFRTLESNPAERQFWTGLMQQAESDNPLLRGEARGEARRAFNDWKKAQPLPAHEVARIYDRLAAKDIEIAEKFKADGKLLSAADVTAGEKINIPNVADDYFRQQLALLDLPSREDFAPGKIGERDFRNARLKTIRENVEMPKRQSSLRVKKGSDMGLTQAMMEFGEEDFFAMMESGDSSLLKKFEVQNKGATGTLDDMMSMRKIAGEYGLLEADVPPVPDFRGLRKIMEAGPEAGLIEDRQKQIGLFLAEIDDLADATSKSPAVKAAMKKTGISPTMADDILGNVKKEMGRMKDGAVRDRENWAGLQNAIRKTYSEAGEQIDDLSGILSGISSGEITEDLAEKISIDSIRDLDVSADDMAKSAARAQRQLGESRERILSASSNLEKFFEKGVAPSDKMMEEFLDAVNDFEDLKTSLRASGDIFDAMPDQLAGLTRLDSYGLKDFEDINGRTVLKDSSRIRKSKATEFAKKLKDEAEIELDDIAPDLTGAKNAKSMIDQKRAGAFREGYAKALERVYGVATTEDGDIDRAAIGAASIDWQKALGFDVMEAPDAVEPLPFKKGSVKSSKMYKDLIEQGDLLGIDEDELIRRMEAAMPSSLNDLPVGQRAARMQEITEKVLDRRDFQAQQLRDNMRHQRLQGIEQAKAMVHNKKVAASSSPDQLLSKATREWRDSILESVVAEGATTADIASIMNEGIPEHVMRELGAATWGMPNDDVIKESVERIFGDRSAQSQLAFNEMRKVVSQAAGVDVENINELSKKSTRLKTRAFVDANKDKPIENKMRTAAVDDKGLKSWYGRIEEANDSAIKALTESTDKMFDDMANNQGRIDQINGQLQTLDKMAYDRALAAGKSKEIIESIGEKNWEAIQGIQVARGTEGGSGVEEKLRSSLMSRGVGASEIDEYVDVASALNRGNADLNYVIEESAVLAAERDVLNQRNNALRESIEANRRISSELSDESVALQRELESRSDLRSLNDERKALEAERDNIKKSLDQNVEMLEIRGDIFEEERLFEKIKKDEDLLERKRVENATRVKGVSEKLGESELAYQRQLEYASELDASGKKFEANTEAQRARGMKRAVNDLYEELDQTILDARLEEEQIAERLMDARHQLEDTVQKIETNPNIAGYRDAVDRLDEVEADIAERVARRGEIIQRDKPRHSPTLRQANQLDALQTAAPAAYSGLGGESLDRVRSAGITVSADDIAFRPDALVGSLDENVLGMLNEITLGQVENVDDAIAIAAKYNIAEDLRPQMANASMNVGRALRRNTDQAEAIFGEEFARALRASIGDGTSLLNLEGEYLARQAALQAAREGKSTEQIDDIVRKILTPSQAGDASYDALTAEGVQRIMDDMAEFSGTEHLKDLDLGALEGSDAAPRFLSDRAQMTGGGLGAWEDQLIRSLGDEESSGARGRFAQSSVYKELRERQKGELPGIINELLDAEDAQRAVVSQAQQELTGLRTISGGIKNDLTRDFNAALSKQRAAENYLEILDAMEANNIHVDRSSREHWEKLRASQSEVVENLTREIDSYEADEKKARRKLDTEAERLHDIQAQKAEVFEKHRDEVRKAFSEFETLDPVQQDALVRGGFIADTLDNIDETASEIEDLQYQASRAMGQADDFEDALKTRLAAEQAKARALDTFARDMDKSNMSYMASASTLDNLKNRTTVGSNGELVLTDTGRTIRGEAYARTMANIDAEDGRVNRRSRANMIMTGGMVDVFDTDGGFDESQQALLSEMHLQDSVEGKERQKYKKKDVERFKRERQREFARQYARQAAIGKIAAGEGLFDIEEYAEQAAFDPEMGGIGRTRGEERQKRKADRKAKRQATPLGRRAARGALRVAAAPVHLPVAGVAKMTKGVASLGKVGAATGGILESMFIPMGGALSGAMGTVFSFLPLLAAIAAVAFLIWKNWDKVSEGIGGALDRLKEAGSQLINAVLEPIRGLFAKLGEDKSGEGLGNLWQNVGQVMGVVMDILSKVMTVVAPIVRMIMEVVGTMIYQFVQFVRLIFAVFTGDWGDAWDAIKNIFESSWNLMRGIAAGIINTIINMCFEMTDFILAAIQNTIGFLGNLISKIPGVGNPLEGAEEGLKSFREEGRLVQKMITSWVDDAVGGSGTLSAKGRAAAKKKGKDTKDAAEDGANEDGGMELKPQIDPEAVAEDGREAAEKFRDAFFRRMDQVVEGWKKAALDVFDDWAKSQVEAIDKKLEAIDKEVEAERKKQQDLDYLQRKEDLRNKKRSAGIKFQSERDLAIYEGRYDDAKQLDYEYNETLNDINREIEDLEKDRQQTLTERVREGERERLRLERDALNERISAQREALQKQLDAITEYTPLNVAAAQNMQAQILAAVNSYTGQYGTAALSQSEEWRKNWVSAMGQAKTDIAHEAAKAGDEVLKSFANALGVSINTDGVSGAAAAGNTGGPGGGGSSQLLDRSIANRDHNAPVRVSYPGQSAGLTPDGKPIKKHSGGPIGNTSMSPSDVPATLQTGEYVVRRSAVARLGTKALETINRGELPVYHTGGFVGIAKKMMGNVAGDAINNFVGGAGKIAGGTIDQLKSAYQSAAFGSMGGSAAMAPTVVGRTMDVAGKSVAQIVDGLIDGIHPDFQARLQAWNAELGNKFDITAGYRSMSQQAYLYDRWQRRVPGQAQAAPPGRSNHNYGLAVDLNPSRTTPSDRAAGAKYGLRWPMSFEPWHVEPNEASLWRQMMLRGQYPRVATAISGGDTSGGNPFTVRDGLFAGVTGGLGDTPVTAGRDEIKAIVRAMLPRFAWSDSEWPSLDRLVSGESSWNPRAANPTTSARGLFQKMTSLHGPIEPTVEGQANWGLNYIKKHKNYGSPSKAYAKWLSRNPHWYHQGGMVFPEMRVGGDVLGDGIAKVHAGETVITRKLTDAIASLNMGNTYNNGGDTPVEVNIHFDGGFFGSDRELQKFQDKMESDIIPKIQRARGAGKRRVSGY